MKTKRVKIIKCSSEEYWYKRKIGEIFEVDADKIRQNARLKYVVEPRRTNYIDADDAKTVIEKEKVVFI